ncbi:Rv2578c family radical SAM protein [Homoserinibacter sp. YIM 151385]|uniref:Rv2578c family radical SAM protein n=1 Tax=Homoserinibacter sp. YIM 151385 TaxID=2985506 RepID=UPI0022F0CB97|nr:Rv2578c family radical SAM protein [Homoserinibacter sp. YIM 151385]WBU36876.1 Rv2578c family radical SAM protein [Homoserinibacter sp. YIM 151385]
MRWSGQALESEAVSALAPLARLSNVVRSVSTPEFAGVTFHEILAKSALNRVPGASALPFGWTVNPYRGCSHACVYCFARPTHEYLDLDAGRDFDSQVVVKVNVAEVLARELARPSWGRHPVALGTNTDPYQRAEGRYRLMPGIVAALAASGTPLSILTKGTLLRRDLPLLVEASERVPVDVSMSIAVFDPELQASIEPGTPSTAARLATVRALREAGLGCAVFLMPVLPHLTDSRAALDEALGRIAEAGATSVAYSALHLRPGVREWFRDWLAREHPDLVPRYAELYGTSVYAPKEYRRWLAQRIRPLIRKHGLDRAELEQGTGTLRSSARREGRAGAIVPGGARRGSGAGATRLAAELAPETAAALQPTLF